MAEVPSAEKSIGYPVSQISGLEVIKSSQVAVVQMHGDIVHLTSASTVELTIFIGPGAVGSHQEPQPNLIGIRSGVLSGWNVDFPGQVLVGKSSVIFGDHNIIWIEAWFMGESPFPGNLPRVEAGLMLLIALAFLWLRPGRKG